VKGGDNVNNKVFTKLLVPSPPNMEKKQAAERSGD